MLPWGRSRVRDRCEHLTDGHTSLVPRSGPKGPRSHSMGTSSPVKHGPRTEPLLAQTWGWCWLFILLKHGCNQSRILFTDAQNTAKHDGTAPDDWFQHNLQAFPPPLGKGWKNQTANCLLPFLFSKESNICLHSLPNCFRVGKLDANKCLTVISLSYLFDVYSFTWHLLVVIQNAD